MQRRQWVQLIQRMRYLIAMFSLGIIMSGIERTIILNAPTEPQGPQSLLCSNTADPHFQPGELPQPPPPLQIPDPSYTSITYYGAVWTVPAAAEDHQAGTP